MKKLLGILFLVTMIILGFSVSALAEDHSTNLYFDYSLLNLTTPTDNNQQVYVMSLGGDYDKDKLAAGVFYGTATSYNPASPGESDYAYSVYGGYNVIRGEDSLAVIASYTDWNDKLDPDTYDATSIGIGIKGMMNFNWGYLSLLYSYGISNVVTENGAKLDGTVNFSYIEAKGVYYFNDSVGIHAAYRSIPVSGDGYTSTLGGFGLGVDFRF